MSIRHRLLRSLISLQTTYGEFHARAPFKLSYIGILGVVAFPFYYFVWSQVFPQPFESLLLRLIGMALCVGLVVEPWWPNALRPYYLIFGYFSLMLCLPAFFTFMLLMNDANIVWLMSATVASLFVVLLYDLFNALIVSILGAAIGIGGFFLLDGIQPLPLAYLVSSPVYLFTITAVGFLTYNERQIADEKLLAAHALASNIAHEMRTPLLGIRLDCDRVQDDIIPLLDATRWAEANGWQGVTLNEKQKSRITAALRRIGDHAVSANLVIEMLLVNVAHDRVSSDRFNTHSIGSVVGMAMDRYHFKPGQKALVSIEKLDDYNFFGSNLLMMHVLFNLLKNSFFALEEKGSGNITIRTRKLGEHNELVIIDTGIGIAAGKQQVIFRPFETSGQRTEGAGIGLSFCKEVIESFGGRIFCRTGRDGGTEFVIELPRVSKKRLSPTDPVSTA